MPAHHIRDYGWGPSHPVIAQTNRWLDRLRDRGDYGRLLAARGHLDAWVASMHRVGRTPGDWTAVSSDDLSGYLAAAAPIGVVRGEASFARQAGPILERWGSEAPELSSAETTAWRARLAEGLRVQRDVLRAHDAFEILLWQHFSDRPPQHPSRVTGWLETVEVGEGRIGVQVAQAAVVGTPHTPFEVAVPLAASARWRVGDLTWLDLCDEHDRPMAVGALVPAAGRAWLQAAGWPGSPLKRLPTEVQARFTGDGVSSWATDVANH